MWEGANATSGLGAICVDTSFVNALQRIADLSFHLTPQTLAAELRKLERLPPILQHHLKPPCRAAIVDEVRALRQPQIELLEQGRVYTF